MRLCFLAAVVFLISCSVEADENCRPLSHADQAFTVCSFDADAEIKLHLKHSDGEIVAQYDRLKEEIREGSELIFAMNAGMYHSDRTPVGLYIEEGQEVAPIVTRAGPGNFGMLPNGVFYIDEGGVPRVAETFSYLESEDASKFATQSGPMLVIDGALHPKFNPDGTSRKRRNGVGISADGETVHFAISDGFVTFHEFATLFRDVLATPNALYLDGTVSRMYAPELGKEENGLDMGPIVSVVH